MNTERVVFSNTVEGLYRTALGNQLSPELRTRLKSMGLNLDAPMLVAYPHDVWVRCLDEVGRALYPYLTPYEARRELGRRMVDGYAETLVGRTVLSMAKLLGPMRSLKRMTHNFRSGNNFTETRMTEVDATTADIWVNDLEATDGFVEGILLEGLHQIGVTHATLTRTRHGPESCTYRIHWAPPSPS